MIETLKKFNSHVPNFIRRNFGRKMVAVFFAVLVFAKVSNELSEEKIIQDIPITILKKGSIEVLAYKPETVGITVQGSKNRLRLLSNSDIKIEIPVDEVELTSGDSDSPATRTVNYTITADDIKTPNGVSVVQIFPSEISIRLDSMKSKELPVEVAFQGGLPDDYSIGGIGIVPKVVTVSGASTIIDQIEHLTTRPVILDKGTVDSFSVERTFQIGDKKILISPKSVQVSVDVYKSMDTKLFQNIIVNMLIGNSPVKNYRVHLLTDKVNVTLGGLNSRLSMLKLDQIKAFVDLSKIEKPGVYDLNVDCWIMDQGVNLKFIDPPLIRAEIIDPKE